MLISKNPVSKLCMDPAHGSLARIMSIGKKGNNWFGLRCTPTTGPLRRQYHMTSTTQMSRTNTHGLRRDAQPAWASNCEGLTCSKYANKINLWHAQYSIEHITAQKRFQKKVNISGTHDNQNKPTYLRVAASTIDSNPLFVTDQQFLPTNHYSERNLIN